MGLMCKLGMHDWGKDCMECARCGKTRNEGHNWSKDCDNCTKCGLRKTDAILSAARNGHVGMMDRQHFVGQFL